MSEFRSPVDIGNRALQYLGQRQMNATLGFNEVSKNATEISFAYGKLRRAELQRNCWTFATRRAALRPIDHDTMILAPALFNSTATYFRGSIVSDQNNNLWISRQANNIGNDPLTSTAWDPYFESLTVSLYDSTANYYTGELVYTAPGDGTYNVYQSQVDGNTLDPSLPNQWNASDTYSQNQVVQAFPAWASGTTYGAGATVTYTDGNTYTSLTAGNIGNTPPLSPSAWATMPVLSLTPTTTPYPTTSPIGEWLSTTAYSLDNFVMFDGNAYVSLQNTNTGNLPNAVASAYWAEVTGGTLYMSLINLNIDNNPASAPALWSSATSYSSGQQVGASDGNIYTSIANGNLNNNPVTDGGVHWTNTGVLNPWTTVFTQGAGNQQWLQVGGAASPSGVALNKLDIVYPVGSGPASQTFTRNVYRLPNGFLKRAPQNPKAGIVPWLGGPGGPWPSDWIFEGNYLVTAQASPIVLRFVADLTDVTQMSDMFCEGLACRIAESLCETLTQSTAKQAEVRISYAMVMGEARTANAIETGSEEPQEDEYITVRY